MGLNKRVFLQTFSVAVIAIATFVAPFASSRAADDNVVRFGRPEFPGITVKTAVVREILDALGYKTRLTKAANLFVLKSVHDGDLDVYLGSWLPADRKFLNRINQDGNLVELATNMPNGWQGLAVPDYTAATGVRSAKDLATHGDMFNKTIYGYGSGTDVDEKIHDAINKDVYGLGSWKVVSGSTSGLMAQVKKNIAEKEPIVFIGWTPHWMNVKWNMHYLTDIKPLLKGSGGKSRVATLSNQDFIDGNPNVVKLLMEFKVDAKVQSAWVYRYAVKGIKARKVARKWIRNNFDVVNQWLAGVQGVSGKPAKTVVRKSLAVND